MRRQTTAHGGRARGGPGRLSRALRLLAAVGVAAACGGSPSGGAPTPSPSGLGTPAATLDPGAPPLAFAADPVARTVSFHLVAAHDRSNAGFNFNGYGRGRLAIAVPEGWRVTVTCENRGPLNHSCAIVRGPADSQPAIAGAGSPDAVTGQAPGATTTFQFVAQGQGTYRIACLVPGHEQAGMWDTFTVGPASARPAASVGA
jgi:FtsP/CotA-like multicopper oxidase with cupredoxin domain